MGLEPFFLGLIVDGKQMVGQLLMFPVKGRTVARQAISS